MKKEHKLLINLREEDGTVPCTMHGPEIEYEYISLISKYLKRESNCNPEDVFQFEIPLIEIATLEVIVSNPKKLERVKVNYENIKINRFEILKQVIYYMNIKEKFTLSHLDALLLNNKLQNQLPKNQDQSKLNKI